MATISRDRVTFKVLQNEIYGDYRVNKYLDDIWVNARDGNWTKEQAEERAENYRKISKRCTTMEDNF